MRLASALAALLAPGILGFVRSYVPTPEGNGPCLWWATRAPAYAVNDGGSRHLAGDAQFAAVQAAFAEWSTPSCTDVAPRFAGLTDSVAVGYDPDAGGVQNVVVWRPALCGAVVPASDPCLQDASCDDAHDCLDDGESIAIAVTSYFYRLDTGELLGAGTELNDADYVFSTADDPPCAQMPPPTAVNPPCVAYDVQGIMTHEAGHFLGFGHSPVPGAVMNPDAGLGDVSKRTLSPDDVDAVCTVYPADGGTLTCIPDAGQPAAPSGCSCGSSGGGAVAWIAALALAAGAARRKRGLRR